MVSSLVPNWLYWILLLGGIIISVLGVGSGVWFFYFLGIGILIGGLISLYIFLNILPTNTLIAQIVRKNANQNIHLLNLVNLSLYKISLVKKRPIISVHPQTLHYKDMIDKADMELLPLYLLCR